MGTKPHLSLMRSKFRQNKDKLLKKLFEENVAISDKRMPWKKMKETSGGAVFKDTSRRNSSYGGEEGEEYHGLDLQSDDEEET